MADRALMTAEDADQLRAELRRLETVERAKVVDQIKTAREWGDLKENAEYHAAKNDQAHLETKIARLRERIAAAVLVDGSSGSEVVGFGSTVRVRDEAGAEHSWQIVSSHEAAPGQGRLSVESPVAVALLGRAVGEHVTVTLPKRERAFTIVGLD